MIINSWSKLAAPAIISVVLTSTSISAFNTKFIPPAPKIALPITVAMENVVATQIAYTESSEPRNINHTIVYPTWLNVLSAVSVASFVVGVLLSLVAIKGAGGILGAVGLMGIVLSYQKVKQFR